MCFFLAFLQKGYIIEGVCKENKNWHRKGNEWYELRFCEKVFA